ncbi:MAG: hypothetical protein JST65_03735 [Acidobacteria bacterium]|nr:hypothetical protein [Acidobacteriota bacterium]
MPVQNSEAPMSTQSLREAAQVGLDQLERGDFISFDTMDEMDQFLDLIVKGMSADDAIAQYRAAKNPL